MIKFATIMANCVQNNLWEFCKKYWTINTENNDICLRGSFSLHTVHTAHHSEQAEWNTRCFTSRAQIFCHKMYSFEENYYGKLKHTARLGYENNLKGNAHFVNVVRLVMHDFTRKVINPLYHWHAAPLLSLIGVLGNGRAWGRWS